MTLYRTHNSKPAKATCFKNKRTLHMLLQCNVFTFLTNITFLQLSTKTTKFRSAIYHIVCQRQLEDLSLAQPCEVGVCIVRSYCTSRPLYRATESEQAERATGRGPHAFEPMPDPPRNGRREGASGHLPKLARERQHCYISIPYDRTTRR